MFQVPGEEEFGATSAAELLLDEELVLVSLTKRYASHQPIWGFAILRSLYKDTNSSKEDT